MNKQPSLAEKLLDFFSAAAELKLLIEPRIADRESFIKNDITRIRVVDTDIVTFYSSPGTIGVGKYINAQVKNETTRNNKCSLPPYAKIFPGNNENRKNEIENFSVALADYIFGKKHVYILPSHVEELQKVIQGIQNGAGGRSDINDFRKEYDNYLKIQAESCNKIKDNNNDTERLKGWIENELNSIRFGTQPVWQLYRLSQLFKNNKLNALINEIESEESTIVGDSDNKLKNRLRELLSERDILDTISIISRTQEWFSILKRHKSNGARTWTIETDAQALALLEYLNKNLKEDKCQFVFITGDNTLLETVRKEKEDKDSPANFIYLYHPKALISDPEFLSPKTKDERPLTHTLNTWLQSFLAGISKSSTNQRAFYSELANLSVIDRNKWIKRINETFTSQMIDDSLNTVTKEWSSLTSEVSVREALRHNGLFNLLNLSETNHFEDLLTCIEKLIVKVWSDFLFGGSGPFLQRISNAPPARGIPPLCFLHLKKANKFIQELYNPSHNPPQEKGNLGSEFDKKLEEIKDNDGTLYSSYLCLSLFFAAEGRWTLAKSFSRYALKIAQQLNDNKITGHEAAFMQAVTHRHLASDNAGLEESRELLKSSKTLFEKLVEFSSDGPPECYWNERYRSEQLAIELTGLYQLKFISNDTSTEFEDKIESTFGQLKNLYADIKKMDKKVNDEWDWVKSYTFELVMVNLLQVGMLWEDSSRKLPADEKTYLHKLFKKDISFVPECLDMERRTNIKLNYFRDRLHEVLYFWFSDDNPSNQHKCEKSLKKHIKERSEVNQNCIKSYDLKRFEWFVSFLAQLKQKQE